MNSNNNSSDLTLLEEKVSPLIISAERKNFTDNSKFSLKLQEEIVQAKVSIVQNNCNSKTELIRAIIRDSWIRSSSYGLSIYDYKFGPVLDKYDFDDLQKKKFLFIKAAMPYIYKLKTICSNCMILLSDEKGVILHVEVDKKGVFHKTVADLHLIPGIVWSEKTVGTLSHTLSLIYKTPMQVCGPEQYSESYHQYTASSAPIFDINTNMAGTITLVSQDIMYQKAHTLALIVSIAEAIQNELHLISRQELLGSFLETADQGVMVTDKSGKITHANPEACKILNYSKPDITGKMISDVLGNQSSINSLLETGKPVFDVEIFNHEANLRTFLSSAKILNDNYGNRLGYSFIFMESRAAGKKSFFVNGLKTKYHFDSIIGKSPRLLQAIDLAKRFARLDNNILIQGESGTGKEIFAQAIHTESCQRGSFIAINCAAIPKDLIESELFGYEAGAFTGADRQGRKGKFELADGGTLFLDEIGDMPLELQPVLLRVLEEKHVMRIGGTRYIPVNFRLISATNQELTKQVERKAFREDLYYRLEELTVSIPPLREREQDIIELAKYFIVEIATKQQISPPSLNEAAIYRLLQYKWPGNVRQLKSAMVHAVNTANGHIIGPENLPQAVNNSSSPIQGDQKSDPAKFGESFGEDRYSIKNMEKMMIIRAILDTNNNLTEAARILGISKATLYKRIKEYELLKEIRNS